MKNISKILYLPLEVNREMTFMLFNYNNIDKLIEERKDELIDKMKISKTAYLKSIKQSNNILEDIIIKFEDDSKIKRFKIWQNLINKFMSSLYDEEDRLYYLIMKYKYQDKLTEEFIRDKTNLDELELREIDIYLKWVLYQYAIKVELYKEDE
ncbi:MAG: hypothetical protein K1W33_00735 [Clostridia bacterium]